MVPVPLLLQNRVGRIFELFPFGPSIKALVYTAAKPSKLALCKIFRWQDNFFKKGKKTQKPGRLQRPCWTKIRHCLSHWRKLMQEEHCSIVQNYSQVACPSISCALVILGVDNYINTNFLIKNSRHVNSYHISMYFM